MGIPPKKQAYKSEIKCIFENLNISSIEVLNFLAQRMRSSSSNESTVSGRIIKIAITAIALGMVMMLIAMGTSLGLQKEIKNKTIALSGDIRIAPFENNNSSISITPIDTIELRKTLFGINLKSGTPIPFIGQRGFVKNQK